MVCFQSILCGEASTNRLPGINPAGYASHTGYQYDSISRVAGHRELAPPSKFSKLGGFNNNVFITSGILHPQPSSYKLGDARLFPLAPPNTSRIGVHGPQDPHTSLPDYPESSQNLSANGAIVHRMAKCRTQWDLQPRKRSDQCGRSRTSSVDAESTPQMRSTHSSCSGFIS